MLRIVVDVPQGELEAENILLAYAETLAGRPLPAVNPDGGLFTRLTATVSAAFLQATVQELLEIEAAWLIDVDILDEVA